MFGLDIVTTINIIIGVATPILSGVVSFLCVKYAHSLAIDERVRQDARELLLKVHLDLQDFFHAVIETYANPQALSEEDNRAVSWSKIVAIQEAITRLNTDRASLSIHCGDKGNDLAKQLKKIIRESQLMVASGPKVPVNEFEKQRDEWFTQVAHLLGSIKSAEKL